MSRTAPQALSDVPSRQLEGSWKIRVQKGRDLVVHGRVENASGSAFLMFNSSLLGASALRGGAFKFLLQGAVGRIKPGSTLHVVTCNGIVPYQSGSMAWQVEPPFTAAGDAVLDVDAQIAKGLRLTKKGTLLAGEVPDSVKQHYFEATRRAEDWFRREYDSPVLVSHGTLLGIYRNGDLVPYDDDFDCLYLSRQPDASAVANERFEIVQRMRAAAFRLKVGSTGHIKLRAETGFVDLMPAWIENDVLYVSSYSEIPGAKDFVEPPRELEWQPYGTLSTFADPEHFLAAQYGPDWRTPDPGYRPKVSDAGKRNRRNLAPSEQERELFR